MSHKKLSDTDENEAVPESVGAVAQVPVGIEDLIDMRSGAKVSRHASTCPAAKAYQKMLGVAAVAVLVIGMIVWLGQSATEKKIDDAVESAFQKRMPYIQLLIKQERAGMSLVPSAAAATSK